LAGFAKRTVLGDSALSVLIPILEDIFNWNSAQIRELFESHGFALQEWDKARIDRVAFQQYVQPISEKLRVCREKAA
jgi:hypothetical protein